MPGRRAFLGGLLVFPMRHMRCWGGFTPQPHVPELRDFADSTLDTPVDGAIHRHNSFARLRFTTTGESLRLVYWADFASNSWLTILVNGVFDQSVSLTADGAEHTTDVTLPAGPKTVEIWEGPQYDNEPSIQTGGLVTSILVLDAPMTMIQPSPPTRRVVIYGDSISQGYPTSPEESYIGLIRRDLAAFGGGLTSLGSGGRALFFDASNPGITDLANDLSDALADSAGLQDLVIVIGTNDWGHVSAPPVATFQGYLEDLVDKVHVRRPSARIRIFSPLERSGEATPNGNGDILDDYRDAMQAVAVDRPSFCTYHHGALIIDAGTDTTDGVHLDASGNAKMKDAVLDAIDEPLSGEFDPFSVGVVRVDLDARFVTTTGGEVTSMIDQSGNGFDATPPTAGERPTLDSSVAAYGGLPAVRFAGNDILTTPEGSATFSPSGGVTSLTIAFVGHADVDETTVNGFAFGTEGIIAHLRTSAAASPKWQCIGNAGTSLDTSTFDADTPAVTVVVFDGPDSKIYCNSKTGEAMGLLDFDLSSSGHFFELGNFIGGPNGVSYVFDGPVLRAIAWEGAMSQGDVETTLDGLGAIYGITIAP